MKRVCSWCGQVMADGATPEAIVTHSICPMCVRKVEEQIADHLAKEEHRVKPK
jgi:hypothetical protein